MNNGYYPYGVGPSDKNIKFDQGSVKDQIDKYKKEEVKQKADLELPHELANITKMLGDTFVSLTDIRNMLTNAQKNKEINQHALDNIKEKIDTVNKIILDIPKDLSKIGI